MQNEMFKEHHPHHLSDYISRGVIDFSSNIIYVSSQKKYERRSLVATIILSSLGMVLASSVNNKKVRRGDGNRESIEDLLCESSGIHFHSLIMRELDSPSKINRFLIFIFQIKSIFLFRLISNISFKVGHRFLGYMYEKRVSNYSDWIDNIKMGKIDDFDAPKIAIGYYELKNDAKFSDVLNCMRDDCIKYRDDEHRYADTK